MTRAPDRDRSAAWLVLRAQSNDRNAETELLGLTMRELRPYVHAMLDDADLAADVVQETLVTIHRHLRSLREPKAYFAWARRIASRRVYAALSRQRRRDALHLPLDEHLPLETAETDEQPNADVLEALPALLSRVSPASREVLHLHYMSELSLDEIATTLDLPIGTVKSRLGYGLRTMRTLLAATGGSGESFRRAR